MESGRGRDVLEELAVDMIHHWQNQGIEIWYDQYDPDLEELRESIDTFLSKMREQFPDVYLDFDHADGMLNTETGWIYGPAQPTDVALVVTPEMFSRREVMKMYLNKDVSGKTSHLVVATSKSLDRSLRDITPQC